MGKSCRPGSSRPNGATGLRLAATLAALCPASPDCHPLPSRAAQSHPCCSLTQQGWPVSPRPSRNTGQVARSLHLGARAEAGQVPRHGWARGEVLLPELESILHSRSSVGWGAATSWGQVFTPGQSIQPGGQDRQSWVHPGHPANKTQHSQGWPRGGARPKSAPKPSTSTSQGQRPPSLSWLSRSHSQTGSAHCGPRKLGPSPSQTLSSGATAGWGPSKPLLASQAQTLVTAIQRCGGQRSQPDRK